MHPAPPEEIREAAAHLTFRDLIVSAVMLDRRQVTDLSWMYLPEQAVPFGRIHEPRNWSPAMAPEGKTHVVAEYFCFQKDRIWNEDDQAITELTVDHLTRMGFINRSEVIGSRVVRVPRAYPVLTVEYRRHYERIMAYLARFTNLQVIGRGGAFRYHNMDHAMESGIEAAETVLRAPEHERRMVQGAKSEAVGRF